MSANLMPFRALWDRDGCKLETHGSCFKTLAGPLPLLAQRLGCPVKEEGGWARPIVEWELLPCLSIPSPEHCIRLWHWCTSHRDASLLSFSPIPEEVRPQTHHHPRDRCFLSLQGGKETNLIAAATPGGIVAGCEEGLTSCSEPKATRRSFPGTSQRLAEVAGPQSAGLRSQSIPPTRASQARPGWGHRGRKPGAPSCGGRERERWAWSCGRGLTYCA